MAERFGVCPCRCHNLCLGTARAANHMGKLMKFLAWMRRAEHWEEIGCVRDTDAVDAAVACDLCRKDHCPALSGRPARSRVV